jgi:hypothetical protein
LDTRSGTGFGRDRDRFGYPTGYSTAYAIRPLDDLSGSAQLWSAATTSSGTAPPQQLTTTSVVAALAPIRAQRPTTMSVVAERGGNYSDMSDR